MDVVIPPLLVRLQKAKDPKPPLQVVVHGLKSLGLKNLGPRNLGSLSR